MVEAIDQVFVNLKHAVVGWAPPAWQAWVSAGLTVAALMGVFMSLFALVVLLERKGLGRIQNRPGPNRVGPWGLLQPMADFIKMLTKEDVVPAGADRVVHFLAPVAMVAPVLLAYAVLPVGRNMAAVDLDAGVLYFFAVGACIELSVFMAGWAGRNKFALLGAMRAIAQMISYELPLMLAAVPAVMLAGTLSLGGIVEAQAVPAGGWLARWHVLTPWGLAGLALFTIAALAEANRSPFDLPEGESEIVAGHLVEYSGFKYALFFIGEYLGMFAVSGLGITLFLGGWRSPASFLDWVPSYLWFFAKLGGFVALFIWLRGTLPRVRGDQLMALAWKLLVPMALLNIAVAAGWHYSAGWSFAGAWLARWGLGLGILGLGYGALARGLYESQGFGPRVYRFAD
ncbi:MAG TPA: NADH-quinone oxidoreductase subunit NuoH [Verrucomicrobiota bacterium]|nr:NADH-quinone oxidoreductase subunit NuoH [Verrucomicrobiota bacterium]HNU51539.1 NADH-quinone oxidoreductase subunit NuoH [Verrucomicrobiota bacterium]